MKYSINKANGKFYILVDKKYITMRLSSGGFFLKKDRDIKFNFKSKEKAIKYLEEEVRPWYEPEIETYEYSPDVNKKIRENLEEIRKITKSDNLNKEECIIKLVGQMLEYDRQGDVENSNKVLDRIEALPREVTILDRIKSIFS